MNIKEIADAVAKFAPNIAGAIGGPFSAIAITLLENLFGVKSDQLPIAIASNPDSEVKLKELELKHGETLAFYENSDYNLQINDNQDARKRETEIIKATGKFDWVQHACALISVTGFFTVIFIVALTKLDQSDHDILYMLLGVLGSTFTQIYQYYFGSSKKQ